jgi:hypothetical protein
MNLAFIALLFSITPLVGQEVNPEYAFAKDGVIAQINGGNVPGDTLTPAASAMFGPITLRSMNLPLFAKPLSDIRAAFGGTIQHWTNFGYVTDWLCYTDGRQRTWYLTEGGEPPESGIVGWFVSEPSNPATDAGYGCTAEAGAMPAAGGYFPMIGATLDELSTHFGTPLAAGTGNVSYFLQEEIGDADGYSLVRMAYYWLVDDVVTAISLSEWNSQ